MWKADALPAHVARNRFTDPVNARLYGDSQENVSLRVRRHRRQQTRTDRHARRTIEIAGSGDLPGVVNRAGLGDMGPDAARIFVDGVVEVDHPAVAIEEHGGRSEEDTYK